MLLKGEFGVCALNSHGNYIVDHEKSWKNHGIVFLNFCGNPVYRANLLFIFNPVLSGCQASILKCLYFSGE